MTFWTLNLVTNSGKIRKEKFNGQDHVVVPATILVEGVLRCATCPQPEFVPAEELEKHYAAWNGRPVTNGHPVVDGQYVSAGSADVWESYTIGTIFNTKFEDGKLTAELWINEELAARNAPDLLDRLDSGENIEVSTGYFADTKTRSGKFNGEEYSAIQSNIKPDHLAILGVGVKGACSWEDGCGLLRAACAGHKPCACDDKVTKIADNEADNENTAKDQLVTNGIKLPDGVLKALGLSDQDMVTALNAALQVEDKTWSWIYAVYRDEGYFVYYSSDDKIYKRDFSISDDGTITLGEDKTQVRPETTYVPIIVNKETGMDKANKISALIGNSATKFSDADKEWLETLTEDQLDKLMPNTEDLAVTAPTVNEDAPVKDQLGLIPNEKIRKSVEYGLRLLENQTNDLIKKITSNKANKFTEDELRAFAEQDLSILEKLAGFAEESDYSGARAIVDNSASEDSVPARPKLFSKSA